MEAFQQARSGEPRSLGVAYAINDFVRGSKATFTR